MSLKEFYQMGKVAYSTPTPSNISYMWNWGSLLGMCLSIQLLSGILLAFHFVSSIPDAFESVISVVEDINYGWILRSIHANGASFFFICIYFHIARGLMYKSFLFSPLTWSVGVVLLLLLMGEAFLGYVLPWGQMSFWGATVITNLLSAVPIYGSLMVEWLWGGFSVSEPTLERFFSLHFILPFVLAFLSVIHIFVLHSSGSSNPLGLNLNSDKLFFHPLFVVKDLMGLLIFICLLMMVSLVKDDLFMDPDNFSLANPMSTPSHIQPEWYFLFAYAILRSVPSKLGGVVALLFSILILFVLPRGKKLSYSRSCLFKTLAWTQFMIFIVLTWLGGMPVEVPFVFLGQVASICYFINFSLLTLFS